MPIFLDVLGWVVLFPILCTLAVIAYWRLRLRPTKGEPPYVSIAGFIFGGWYGFVVTVCIMVGGSFVLLFDFPRTAAGMQQQVGIECISAIVGLGTAFGGKYLANKFVGPRGKMGANSGTDTRGNPSSI